MSWSSHSQADRAGDMEHEKKQVDEYAEISLKSGELASEIAKRVKGKFSPRLTAAGQVKRFQLPRELESRRQMLEAVMVTYLTEHVDEEYGNIALSSSFSDSWMLDCLGPLFATLHNNEAELYFAFSNFIKQCTQEIDE